jgi:hypothetical protein
MAGKAIGGGSHVIRNRCLHVIRPYFFPNNDFGSFFPSSSARVEPRKKRVLELNRRNWRGVARGLHRWKMGFSLGQKFLFIVTEPTIRRLLEGRINEGWHEQTVHLQ